MIINGNGNVVAGRDIVVASTVDNREYKGIPHEYQTEVRDVIAQMQHSKEPSSIAAKYIERISRSAPVEVLSAIFKLISKFL